MARSEKSSGFASRSNASAYTVNTSPLSPAPPPYCAPPDWLYTCRYSTRPTNPTERASRSARARRRRDSSGGIGSGERKVIQTLYPGPRRPAEGQKLGLGAAAHAGIEQQLHAA